MVENINNTSIKYPCTLLKISKHWDRQKAIIKGVINGQMNKWLISHYSKAGRNKNFHDVLNA